MIFDRDVILQVLALISSHVTDKDCEFSSLSNQLYTKYIEIYRGKSEHHINKFKEA